MTRAEIEAARKTAAELRAARLDASKPKNDADASVLEKSLQTKSAPFVTTGPVGESRGFRLTKALALHRGMIGPEQAKPEIEASRCFRKALADFNYLPPNSDMTSVLVPFGSELLPTEVTSTENFVRCKSMWAAGLDRHDPDETTWLANRMLAKSGGDPNDVRYKTAMSYLQQSIGGTLVAPPVQGELIELVRPRECLMAAGATSVPLPPNGRMVFPRQSSPTSAYWVGENTAITESNPGTGQIALQAKKLAVLVTVPNELLLYASVAADAMIRTDTAKTISLAVDYAGLYGTGGAAQPQGLVNYTGTNQLIQYQSVTPAPKGIGTDGNTLRPEDGNRMVGLIEDRNFEFSGWIFRPTMANNILGYRADAVAAKDAAGGFVQSLIRAVTDRVPSDNWCGYKTTKSAVIRNNLTKGAGTNLTELFGGQWEHLMIGMYGAVEFATSNQAGNTFAQDQTQIRAIAHVDSAPRYEGAFCWYPYLINATN